MMVNEILKGISSNKSRFITLCKAAQMMCDLFPLPNTDNATNDDTADDIAVERRSHNIPSELQSRVTGDSIRLMLIPGHDAIPNDGMSDVFTILGILSKYRSNMPDVVWYMLYEIAIKNYIRATMGGDMKKMFEEIRNDPEVRKMIAKMMSDDDQNQTLEA